MYINNGQQYTVNYANTVAELRLVLATKFFNKSPNSGTYIGNLVDIVSQHIDNASIEFKDNTISVKIRKTGMKNMYKNLFSHTSEFYSMVMSDVYFQFINNFKNDICQYIDSEKVNELLNNPICLSGLCNTFCISDNTVNITI